MQKIALQDQYASQSRCFGCGPANEKGLRIKSFVSGEEVVASFMPEEHHQAFAGVLSGGIIATILDCHCNWAACWYLQSKQQLPEPPSTVTGQFELKLKRPTPTQNPLTLIAHCDQLTETTATVHGKLLAGDTITALFTGTFHAVKPDHPAYQRW